MFSNNTPKALVHLPSRSQQPSPSDQLPEGECRFILPETGADGSRPRCTCVTFTLNKEVPGSQCGCGHQAWHHVRQSTSNTNSVPLEEYHRLFDRFQRLEETARRLQEELSRERRERDKATKDMVQMLRGNYSNMAYLRYYVDEKMEILRLHCEDKTEGVLDKAHGANEEVDKLKARLAEYDETIIRLEEKIDSTRWQSRSMTPVHETQMDMTPVTPVPVPAIPAALAIRTEDKHPEAWDVRVILVPSKNQSNAFTVDSLAYKRCQSRGLQQDIHMQDKSAAQFIQCVEAGFATILRGRMWVPLMCLRSTDMSLTQIPPQERDPVRWNYTFLESQCMASDKAQGDVIYIALQDGELTWSDIRGLPRVFGSDETCWNPDPELDGPPPTPASSHKMDYDMTKPPSDMRIDSDSVYEYSPPPYTSGGSISHQLPSALGVLAGAATYLADQNGSRTPSIQSAPSRPASSHPGTPSIAGSMGSMKTIEEDDEHRDKRTKWGALRPEAQPMGLPLAPVVSSPPQPTQYYYSGRSKRKMPTGKSKEPLDWRVSEIKIGNPAKGLFHRHNSDKEKHAQAQQAQQQQQQSEQASRA
jgi:hypothetical protein